MWVPRTEAVARRCSVKKVVLEIWQKFTATLLKTETLVRVLSCQFCEISKKHLFLQEHLRWLLLQELKKTKAWKATVWNIMVQGYHNFVIV